VLAGFENVICQASGEFFNEPVDFSKYKRNNISVLSQDDGFPARSNLPAFNTGLALPTRNNLAIKTKNTIKEITEIAEPKVAIAFHSK